MVFFRKNTVRWVLFISVFFLSCEHASLLAADNNDSSFKEEASFSLILNQRMMALYEKQKWQEIVHRVPVVQNEIKQSIERKNLGLTYDTFHIIGQAYLNGYTFAQADPQYYPE